MLDTQCDCIAFQDPDQGAHQLVCALWDNDWFAKGLADWDPGSRHLVIRGKGSLHLVEEDEIGGPLGEVVEVDPLGEAVELFYQRCDEVEDALWASLVNKEIAWDDMPNYTIDGISRVFVPAEGEWRDEELKCHCVPPEQIVCLRCGVERWSNAGDYWATMWHPINVDEADIMCRCPGREFQKWWCHKCEVKRMPGTPPGKQPMMKSTTEMAKRKSKKSKGGVTSWSNWSKGAQTYELCRHKGRELEFPNGKKIYGSSASAKAPDGYVPDFGIYLDSCWYSNQTCLGIALPWQDMGLPRLDRDHVDTAVELACRMIDKGDVLEVGCIGGHGRTGTFLALVAMRNGVETPEEAITYVREHYCEKAIESSMQEWYIKAWYAEDHGLPVPEKPKPQSLKASTGYGHSYQKNKGTVTTKKCDGKPTWYCPGCNADQDDDAESCYWCLAEFDNPGIRPIEEWYQCSSPKKIAAVEARILKPKVVEDKRVKQEVVKTKEPELPFDNHMGWFGAY